jgi:predicted nuclease of predicted toxin-antitoxin system
MATFFFDNDISFRIAHALSNLVEGHDIVALRDRFPTNTPDTVWIPEVARNDWIVISRDHNQRRRESEHKALRENHARVLYIRYAGNVDTLFADAARLVKNWPKIEAWGLGAAPGTLARLNTADQIENL